MNPLDAIANNAINDYKKVAYIGYRYEGVNPAILLCRLGLWDVATNIMNFFRDRYYDYHYIIIIIIIIIMIDIMTFNRSMPWIL